MKTGRTANIDEDLKDDDLTDDTASQETSTFSFADLQPKEGLDFELADGSKIPFKQPEDMTSDDVAIMSSLEKRMNAAIEQMQKNFRDEKAKAAMDKLTSHFIRLILPDLPEEALTGFKLGQKTKLVRWWNEHTGAEKKG